MEQWPAVRFLHEPFGVSKDDNWSEQTPKRHKKGRVSVALTDTEEEMWATSWLVGTLFWFLVLEVRFLFGV